MAALRTSLIPGILQVIRHNIFHGNTNLRLFEFGKVYYHDYSSKRKKLVDNYVEEDCLIMALSGMTFPQNWGETTRFVDIFDVKGEVQTLFKKNFLDNVKFIPYSKSNALTQMGILIEINGESAGFFGLVQKDLVKKYEIEQDVYVVELSKDVLAQNVIRDRKYRELPKYPSVMRDVAFVVDREVPVEKIEVEIRKAGMPILRKLELFDVYRGNQIQEDKKSCAFALEFSSDERTLVQDDIDKVMQNIINCISEKFNATLRG